MEYYSPHVPHVYICGIGGIAIAYANIAILSYNT